MLGQRGSRAPGQWDRQRHEHAGGGRRWAQIRRRQPLVPAHVRPDTRRGGLLLGRQLHWSVGERDDGVELGADAGRAAAAHALSWSPRSARASWRVSVARGPRAAARGAELRLV